MVKTLLYLYPSIERSEIMSNLVHTATAPKITWVLILDLDSILLIQHAP